MGGAIQNIQTKIWHLNLLERPGTAAGFASIRSETLHILLVKLKNINWIIYITPLKKLVILQTVLEQILASRRYIRVTNCTWRVQKQADKPNLAQFLYTINWPCCPINGILVLEPLIGFIDILRPELLSHHAHFHSLRWEQWSQDVSNRKLSQLFQLLQSLMTFQSAVVMQLMYAPWMTSDTR